MYRVPRHRARHTPAIGRQHMFGNALIEVNSCHSSMDDKKFMGSSILRENNQLSYHCLFSLVRLK